MVNQFNLIDEPWIPVTGSDPISLKKVFSDLSATQLGGTAIQKLSVLKLLLAIAQRAATPDDELQWRKLGAQGIGDACSAYLENNYEHFYLYGERPFLQFPVLETVKQHNGKDLPIMPIGRSFHPDVPAANDSIINQFQINRISSDAEKALFVISIMNYSLGGKRVAHIPPLSPLFETKGKSAKPGPSLGNYIGYLQTCFWGNSILETVWLNLFTKKDFQNYPQWKTDTLTPPWEQMPTGEDDDTARKLKESYMGTLIGLCRFTLLKEDGILFTEGIQYPSHKEGWREPFMTIRTGDKVQFLDTNKKPWRNLDALLSITLAKIDKGQNCPQIQTFLTRTRTAVSRFGVWSGGLQVRGTAGDQSVKQDDDFVESLVWMDSEALGEGWYSNLENQMAWLEKTAGLLTTAVKRYYTELKDPKTRIDSVAVSQYWEFCESFFQTIVTQCEEPESLLPIRRKIAEEVDALYSRYCGRESARQMIAWVKHRPTIWWKN